MANTAIVWFRRDLRVADHPALTAALAASEKVVALHVLEPGPVPRPSGGASRWWLHQSLNQLAESLAALRVILEVQDGPAETVMADRVRHHKVNAVFWNRRYEPGARDIDAAIKSALKEQGILAESFIGDVLVEPFDITTAAGGPYSVYSPFWRALRSRDIPAPLPAPRHSSAPAKGHQVDDGYEAAPWTGKLQEHWKIGEAAARNRLAHFLERKVGAYPDARDLPGRDATSRLSPHLAFGEISPRQVWHAALHHVERHPGDGAAVDKFLSELAWREFNIHQLYHRENIAEMAMQPKFDAMPWRDAPADLAAWQRSRTGIPIVDAGMRELWATGYMHNRVRMLVASLLAKNLGIDWRQGERWFWDTLCDADVANNPGNWQWVAGCGLDAAPYFRIFNPVLQGEKFDPDGAYVRRWVPELAKLPDRWIHKPWEAPEAELSTAKVRLGTDYPRPILDLKRSREAALAAFQRLGDR